jgi:hypothetical protein
MSSIYDFIDNNERSFLEAYIELTEKQPKSTTGAISISALGNRILTDANAEFLTNSVSEGDTVQFFATSPLSVTPSLGFYTITDVISETELQYNGSNKPLGVHASYRVISTGLLQQKVNALSSQIASTTTADLADAIFQEGINLPWYQQATSAVAGFPLAAVGFPSTTIPVGGYFLERNGLDDNQFLYPVTDTDIAAATAVPVTVITTPGPLLFPFFYTQINPDRRGGAAASGLGTPSLLGFPDSGPRAPTAYSPPTTIDVQADLGELPAITEEEVFYNTFTYPYSVDEEQRLNSIKTAITNALNRQISSINGLITLLSDNITDLQNRGLTGTGFYTTLAVARTRLNAALVKATFHLTDVTVGVPAITTGSAPSAARRTFITVTRPAEIANRVTQILQDQAPWVDMRYAFLARRASRADGSLSVINRSNFRLTDLNDRIEVLLDEREQIQNILGE